MFSYPSAAGHVRLIVSSLLLGCAVALPAKGETSETPAVAAETCAAMFSVMAYTQGYDDAKELLLEDKKARALVDIQPADDAATGEPQSLQERVDRQMNVLTEMLLEKPAEAQAILSECFRQYPPEISLN